MASMKLHFLDARGTLTALHHWLHKCLTETHEKAAGLMPLQPLDVVVQTGKRIIPEKGHVGYTPKPGVVFITVDPDNPALKANVDASLERMFAHELHHAARWDGPGYGSSLGEALVSEGLAGHFVLELFGGLPEPWEQLPESEIRVHATLAAQKWESADYNHEAWFFGRGDLPRWLGYSLGFRLVGQFLSEHPGSGPSKLAVAQAQDFRLALSLV
ncbi:MAG: peptidase [Alphaproteobacteria bacterium]|nr:peptidase [Alphaproteobacteria bacterium]MBM3651895.1 peptidase [Alphaproteobacteria bacterium]